MKEWVKEHMLYVLAAGLVAIGGGFYFFTDNKSIGSNETHELIESPQPADESEKGNSPPPAESPLPEKVVVDVKGQVKMPGVYQSFPGERVIDLIERAGGLTDHADESKVNFAEHVQDAMVIYIPAIGEEGSPISEGSGLAASTGDHPSKININTADETELQNLPGIGPAKASAIIEYRETNGLFQAVGDLKNISGIGDKTFDKLKDLIVVH